MQCYTYFIMLSLLSSNSILSSFFIRFFNIENPLYTPKMQRFICIRCGVLSHLSYCADQLKTESLTVNHHQCWSHYGVVQHVSKLTCVASGLNCVHAYFCAFDFHEFDAHTHTHTMTMATTMVKPILYNGFSGFWIFFMSFVQIFLNFSFTTLNFMCCFLQILFEKKCTVHLSNIFYRTLIS